MDKRTDPFVVSTTSVQAFDQSQMTLHQLADVMVDLAAESPTVIAGGLLVAARAMRAYAEAQGA